MKAKIIKTLRIDGKPVRPSQGKVVLVDLSDGEFARLANMGAVSKPTSDDLKLAGEVPADAKPAVSKVDAARSTKAKAPEAKTEASKGADPAAVL